MHSDERRASATHPVGPTEGIRAAGSIRVTHAHNTKYTVYSNHTIVRYIYIYMPIPQASAHGRPDNIMNTRADPIGRDRPCAAA